MVVELRTAELGVVPGLGASGQKAERRAARAPPGPVAGPGGVGRPTYPPRGLRERSRHGGRRPGTGAGGRHRGNAREVGGVA